MLPELPSLDGVRHSYVDVGGLSLHVAEAGARDGRPLLLQHGWPQNWWCWHKLIPTLAGAGFRVIAPDLRGHGWSDAPPGGYDKPQFARDMLALMDALELDRVDLIGHDWGAMAGFLACMEAPERFGHFLALSIVPPFPSSNPRSVLHIWRFYYQFLLAAPGSAKLLQRRPLVARVVLPSGQSRQDAFEPSDLALYGRVLSAPAHAKASQTLYRTFLRHELLPMALGRYAKPLSVPTRLLIGDDDPVCKPAMIDGYERWASDMEFEVLAGVGHFLPEEAPAEVAERALTLFS